MPVTCGMCQDVFDSDLKFTDHFLLVHTSDDGVDLEDDLSINTVTVTTDESPECVSKNDNTCPISEVDHSLNTSKPKRKKFSELFYSPNKCRICDEEKTDKGKLAFHILAHLGSVPYFCIPCGFACISKLRFQQHVYNHQIKNLNSDPYERHWLFTKNNVHECEICHRTFRAWVDLVLHYQIHILGFRYSCTFCKFYFSEAYELQIHDHLHKSTKSCDLCGIIFSSKNRLLDHVLHHGRDKMFRKFHQIMWNDGLSAIQNPFSVLRANHLGEGYNEVTFDPKDSQENLKDTYSEATFINNSNLKLQSEEELFYGSNDVSHLCQVVFKELSGIFIPRIPSMPVKKASIINKFQKKIVLVKLLQPSNHSIVSHHETTIGRNEEVSSIDLKLNNISCCDNKKRMGKDPIDMIDKSSSEKLIQNQNKELNSIKSVSKTETFEAKLNGVVSDKPSKKLRTYSKSKLVKTKISVDDSPEKINSNDEHKLNFDQTLEDFDQSKVVTQRYPRLILEKLPSDVDDLKSYRRHMDRERKRRRKIYWKKVAERREKEIAARCVKSDPGLITRSGKVIKTNIEHISESTSVELDEKFIQATNPGLVTRSGRVLKELDDVIGKQVSLEGIENQNLCVVRNLNPKLDSKVSNNTLESPNLEISEALSSSGNNLEEVNSNLVTRSGRVVKLLDPTLNKIPPRKCVGSSKECIKKIKINEDSVVDRSIKDNGTTQDSTTPIKALNSFTDLAASVSKSKRLVSNKTNVKKKTKCQVISNINEKTDVSILKSISNCTVNNIHPAKETILNDLTLKSADISPNTINLNLSSSDNDLFTAVDKLDSCAEIDDKHESSLNSLSYTCMIINHDHTYQNMNESKDVCSSPSKENSNKVKSSLKSKLVINNFKINRKVKVCNRKIIQRKRTAEGSNRKGKLAIKKNLSNKYHNALSKRRIKLLKSRAKSSKLQIKLVRLPECIYEKHLKSKPIMLSNVLPVISDVLSFDVNNGTFLNHFTIMPFNLDDHNYCKLNGNNWPVPDSDSSDSESTLSSYSIPLNES